MDPMDLSRLLRPRSIAVVGATPRTFVGRIALENCRPERFSGSVFAVNPRYDDICGIPCYPSVSELPEVPDVVLVQLATARVLEAVEQAVTLDVPGFVIPGGGHTDSGDHAAQLRAGLARLARQVPVQIIGPNCMGVVDLVTGAAPYVGTVPSHVRRGTVAAVAQSGAIVEALVNSGGRVPLSTAVSTGSETVTAMHDYLHYFAADDETEAVLAFVEGFDDPDAFVAAARELAQAGKQLAVCLVGRSAVAQAGVSAHSGKLAPSYDVAAAALRQAGAVIADDLDELLALGEILGSGRRVPGRRMHVVANSGGEANLIADLAADAGLELPAMSIAAAERLGDRWPDFHVANPLDPWGADDYRQIYPEAIAAAAQEPGDIVMVSIDQQLWSGDFERQLGRDLAAYLAAQGTDKLPVFLSPASQDPDPELAEVCRAAAIPLLRGASAACSALGKLERAGLVDPPTRVDERRPEPVALGPGAMTEIDALHLLHSFGVEVPATLEAATPSAAAVVAREIGGTVVVKGMAPGLLHKSEHNLVEVGVVGEHQARAAAERIAAQAERAGTEVRYLVMEQVRGALDVYVGYKRDPQFGPTFLVGLGGVWTEFLGEVEIHVGDLDDAAARRLVSASKAGDMMRRARGGALCADDVVRALVAVADLVAACPAIAAVDINPLIVSRERAVAVDAVIETAPTTREEAMK
jgi:acyl-CoA synthetase (NDP forming)